MDVLPETAQAFSYFSVHHTVLLIGIYCNNPSSESTALSVQFVTLFTQDAPLSQSASSSRSHSTFACCHHPELVVSLLSSHRGTTSRSESVSKPKSAANNDIQILTVLVVSHNSSIPLFLCTRHAFLTEPKPIRPSVLMCVFPQYLHRVVHTVEDFDVLMLEMIDAVMIVAYYWTVTHVLVPPETLPTLAVHSTLF